MHAAKASSKPNLTSMLTNSNALRAGNAAIARRMSAAGVCAVPRSNLNRLKRDSFANTEPNSARNVHSPSSNDSNNGSEPTTSHARQPSSFIEVRDKCLKLCKPAKGVKSAVRAKPARDLRRNSCNFGARASGLGSKEPSLIANAAREVRPGRAVQAASTALAGQRHSSRRSNVSTVAMCCENCSQKTVSFCGSNILRRSSHFVP